MGTITVLEVNRFRWNQRLNLAILRSMMEGYLIDLALIVFIDGRLWGISILIQNIPIIF